MAVFVPKTVRLLSSKVISSSKGCMIIWHSFKDVTLKKNMIKFLVIRQMASLQRSAGEKFDEETNLWRFFSLSEISSKITTKTSFVIGHPKQREVVYLFLSINT